MISQGKILVNGIRTPDGTELFSRHRHDYRTHEDANGETYMVDGGLDYCRRNVCSAEPEELTQLYKPGDHEHNREHLHWGTYGPEHKGPLQWKPVKSLATEHIEAILSDYDEGRQPLRDYYVEIMRAELEWRSQLQ